MEIEYRGRAAISCRWSSIVASRRMHLRVTRRTAAVREAFIGSRLPPTSFPLPSVSVLAARHISLSLSLIVRIVSSKARVRVRAYCRDNCAFVQLRARAGAFTAQCSAVRTQCITRTTATSSSERGPVREIETTTRSYNGMLTSDANYCLCARGCEPHVGERVQRALAFGTATNYRFIDVHFFLSFIEFLCINKNQIGYWLCEECNMVQKLNTIYLIWNLIIFLFFLIIRKGILFNTS